MDGVTGRGIAYLKAESKESLLREIYENGTRIGVTSGIRHKGTEEGYTLYSVRSGKYLFECSKLCNVIVSL